MVVFRKCFIATFLRAGKRFGTLVPVLVNLEVLGRPEPLLTIFILAGQGSRRLWLVTSDVRLEMCFPKISLLAGLADERSLSGMGPFVFLQSRRFGISFIASRVCALVSPFRIGHEFPVYENWSRGSARFWGLKVRLFRVGWL